MKLASSAEGAIEFFEVSDLVGRGKKIPIEEFRMRPEAAKIFGQLVLGLFDENVWSGDFSFLATIRPENKSFMVIYGRWLPDINGTRAIVIREDGVIPTIEMVALQLIRQYDRYDDGLQISIRELRNTHEEINLRTGVFERDLANTIIRAKVRGEKYLSAPTVSKGWCFVADSANQRLLCVKLSGLREHDFQVYEIPGLMLTDYNIFGSSHEIFETSVTAKMVPLA